MKTCPYCAEEIQDAAIVCKHCQRDLRTGAPPTPPKAGPSNGVAAVLSFFIPGLGQIYKGNVGAGIAFLLFAILGYAMYILPGLVIHLIAVINAAAAEPSSRPAINPAQAGAATIDAARPMTDAERRQSQKTGKIILAIVGVGVLALIGASVIPTITSRTSPAPRASAVATPVTQPGARESDKPQFQLLASKGSMMRFVVVTADQAKSDEELWRIADYLDTKSINGVRVLFWTSGYDAAAGLPMTDHQLETQVAQINTNHTTKLRELRRGPFK